MASIHDILTSETKTDHSVRLYREGSLFYRAYERSAYLFVHHVRDYQAVRKFYKVCNSFVVSIGFPQKSLPSLGCQYIENADGTVSIPVEVEIDEQQYQQWKAEQISHQKLLVMIYQAKVHAEVRALWGERVENHSASRDRQAF